MNAPITPTQVDPNRELPAAFAPYLGMMDFLAALLGPRAEVVLHDTSDLSRSVVALTNGHISGRSIGAPATDLVLKVLRNHEDDDVDYLANYLAESSSGVQFRSSTMFIRNGDRNVIGMLCINIDDSALIDARDALSALTAVTEMGKDAATHENGTVTQRASTLSSRSAVAERLSVSAEELTLDSVKRIVAAQGVEALRMTAEEKLEAVRALDRAGMFLLKGAVAHVASVLEVSEPSIYRYLRQVRQGS